jgi:hypothetical protein
LAQILPIRDVFGRCCGRWKGLALKLVRTRTEGRITGVDEVVLVDISLGGVKIEHAQFFRPGTISPLDLEFHGTRIRLWSRVVWSVVARQEMNMDGEGVMIYYTGLEFHNPSEETRQVINDYLQAMITWMERES